MKIVSSHSLKISAVTFLLLSFFLLGPALAADRWQIVTQVTIPQNAACGIAVNEALNKIYVSGGASFSQVAAVIDGSTFGVTTIGTGSTGDVDTVTNRYWAGGVFDSTAHVYNGSTNAQITTVSLGYLPVSAYIDPVRRWAWVAAQGGSGSGDPVWAVNADTYAVVHGPIWTGGTMGPLIANSATGRAYIGPSGASKRIDPNTFAVTGNGFGVVSAVNPITNRLYAVSGTYLQVLDGAPDPEVILTTVPLTFSPGGIGIDTKLNLVYIANGAGNCLRIMNGQTNTLTGTVPLGTGVSPYLVAVDSTRSRIYVLASTSSGAVVYVIQHDTILPVKMVTQVAIPQNAACGVAVNEALNKIYVSGGASFSQVAAVIDGSTFGVTTMGAGSAGDVDTVTNRYWAGGVFDSMAHVYDGSTNAPVTAVSLGYLPISACIDPVRRWAWVAAQGGGGSGDPVWAVNADTYGVAHGPIWTGGTMGPLVANSATGRAYIGPNGVSKRIDPNTFAVTGNSFGVVSAVNPKTNRLYAVSGTNLQVLDGAPNPEVILTTIPLTFSPGGIGINTQQNRVYLANGAGNCLQFLDGKTNTLGGIIPFATGVSPYLVAVDSKRSRIYVLASTSGGVVLFVLQDNMISTTAINLLLLE